MAITLGSDLSGRFVTGPNGRAMSMEYELIQACIENDRRAQQAFYQKYHGKMMGACLRYASNRDEALEIMNMGFLKVFKKLKHFNLEQGNLEGWIYRIMINTAIDHHRKEYKHKYSVDLDHAPEPYAPSEAFSKMGADEIMKLIQQLTPAYRTVFNLYAIEGYNHREIGEKLGISEGTSKSNFAKARKRLQEMIRAIEKENLKSYAE